MTWNPTQADVVLADQAFEDHMLSVAQEDLPRENHEDRELRSEDETA